MWAHWHAFHWTIVAAKLKFDPVHSCLDFEKSLKNAAKDQVQDDVLIGCVFTGNRHSADTRCPFEFTRSKSNLQ